MTFPVATNGNFHVENDTRYICRNNRWEKYNQPDVVTYGVSSTAGLNQMFGGSNWAWVRVDSGQHVANDLIRFTSSFVPSNNSNPMFGVFSNRDNKWLNPKTDMDSWDGMVHWGGGGTDNNTYHKSSFNNDAFILSLSDDNTRLCKSGRAQFAEVMIMRLGSNKSQIVIRMSQSVKDGGYFCESQARGTIRRPISDITKLFIKVSAGVFQDGRGSLEVY